MLETIITIAVAVIIVGLVLGSYIYKKSHKMPTGDCACCQKVNWKKIQKEIKKAEQKEHTNDIN
jgi:hypothetical protein